MQLLGPFLPARIMDDVHFHCLVLPLATHVQSTLVAWFVFARDQARRSCTATGPICQNINDME